MRLFTAVDPDRSVADRLTALIEELRSTANLRWSLPANLHITTRFIGEWPDARLPELQAALAEIPFTPFSVQVERFGFFPNPHRPHTFFAGVRTAPQLAKLAGATNRALAALGLAEEDRTYTPHVTLARIKNQDIGELRRRVAAIDNPAFGEFELRGFHLYRSTPSFGGSVYTKVSTYAVKEEIS